MTNQGLTTRRAIVKKGTTFLRQRVAGGVSVRPAAQELAPAYARIHAPTNPVDRIRIGKRWYTTRVRSFLRSFHHDIVAPNVKPLLQKPKYAPVSQHFRTASPFASTLRPRLNGGAMPRTAGGYTLGGNGARFFSCTPNAPAQVIQQVSQAIRAFAISSEGKYGDYRRSDGTLGKLGVRAAIAASLVDGSAPGSYVDFDLAPTYTALSPLRSGRLESPSFLASLGSDFANMIGDVTATYGDIQRLAKLGDLPISLAGERRDILRVHFPGCEREFVERLCAELEIRRGMVHEDEQFSFGHSMLDMDHMRSAEKKLEWRDMLSETSSVWSEDGFNDEVSLVMPSPDAFEYEDVGSLDGSNYFESTSSGSELARFEGVQGMYLFMNEFGESRSGYI